MCRMKKLKEEMEGVVKELAENNHILERCVIGNSSCIVLIVLVPICAVSSCTPAKALTKVCEKMKDLFWCTSL